MGAVAEEVRGQPSIHAGRVAVRIMQARHQDREITLRPGLTSNA